MNDALINIERKINMLNSKIEKDIDNSVNDRGYMSQNLVKTFRDFTEYIIFKVYLLEDVKTYIEYNQENLGKAIKYIKSKYKHNVLRVFHEILQIGPSHNSFDEDGSIRLVVKYREYLIRLRDYYYDYFNVRILKNLYKYPIYKIDQSLSNYYDQIGKLISVTRVDSSITINSQAYYIQKSKPVVLKTCTFYELTLSPATDYTNKSNRIIVYSPTMIPDNYAVKISYDVRNISVFESTNTVKIINNYSIFIKPSEVNTLYRIFGYDQRISCKSFEYDFFMSFLKENRCCLNDIVNFDDVEFKMLKNKTSTFSSHHIYNLLTLIRKIVKNDLPGKNVLKYLIYFLRNGILLNQVSSEKCYKLSNLYLNYGCLVFETMPYASSLINHNVLASKIMDIISPLGREHEIFSRRLNDLCNKTNRLYFSFEELGYDKEIGIQLIKKFNSKVYAKHNDRVIGVYGNKVYVEGYEKSTVDIIRILSQKSKVTYEPYEKMYDSFCVFDDYVFTDLHKKEICEKLFCNSSLALIYGSAGTGKTEMIKIVSKIFSGKKTVFLSKTNAAINNMKHRVESSSSGNYDFSTIDSFIFNKSRDKYDLIIVDESSMVENDIMLSLLRDFDYDCLLLVGDIYQIESIEFGNWFRFAKEFVQDSSYELTENFRTTNKSLKSLWKKVRNLEDGITEKTIDDNYVSPINNSIFEDRKESEIVLCLNYDGPYGINNINTYLQKCNSNEAVEWGINAYKVNDPIIFSDSKRFSGILYNNLQGKILKIIKSEKSITFELFVERLITGIQSIIYDFKLIESKDNGSIISIKVSIKEDEDKDDEDKYVVPFFVSYAASIHKSQGLEYDSVKIIISDESEELITKNIFYTAITRSKGDLKIYWSPECQNKVLKNMKDYTLKDDVITLRNKYSIDFIS